MVEPDAKLEEELIIRPTCVAIIWNTYKDWILSYRDLPVLIIQWSNVVRWEIRTRMFLRTAEFLWHEGHAAHASEHEAIDEAITMMNVCSDFVENWMALPVWKGIKSENERFACASETYCIEALMHDGKALQAGTSHFLGQNFTKAEEFQTIIKEKGEFISSHWDDTPEAEEKIKEITKATIVVIHVDTELEKGECVLTGKPSEKRVMFSVVY